MPSDLPAAFALRFLSSPPSAVPPHAPELGVPHEPQPLSDVRRADTTCCKIGNPKGVIFRRQVSVNKVEPNLASLAGNLLAKDRCRLFDSDEMVPVWPEVPLVSKPAAFARRGERLARTRASPYFSISGKIGKRESVGPAADAGEEVALPVGFEIVGGNVENGACIYITVRDELSSDQIF